MFLQARSSRARSLNTLSGFRIELITFRVVVASETRISRTVFVRFLQNNREESLNEIMRVVSELVSWDHGSFAPIPGFVQESIVDFLLSRLDFWRPFNDHVIRTGPSLPLKLFKHATQSFYSRKKLRSRQRDSI